MIPYQHLVFGSGDINYVKGVIPEEARSSLFLDFGTSLKWQTAQA